MPSKSSLQTRSKNAVPYCSTRVSIIFHQGESGQEYGSFVFGLPSSREFIFQFTTTSICASGLRGFWMLQRSVVALTRPVMIRCLVMRRLNERVVFVLVHVSSSCPAAATPRERIEV